MPNSIPKTDSDTLKRELVGLFNHIQRIRKEIASIRKPGAAESDHFVQMSDELEAIVSATEGATNSIMTAAEEIEEIVAGVTADLGESGGAAALGQIPDKTATIFEACAFQDITGQRITKVVKSLQYIEQRVNTLINMWGAEEIAETDPVHEEVKDEYQKYLNGPQLEGQGVSQSDVDALLNGAAPPPKPAAPAKTSASTPKPASAPAPAAAPAPSSGDPGAGALGQNDIDKLFG